MTIWWEFLLQDYKINNASLHCIVYRRKPLPNCNYKSFKENESWLWKQVMQMMFLFDFVESNHKSAVDSRLELGTEILIVKKTQKLFLFQLPSDERKATGSLPQVILFTDGKFQQVVIPKDLILLGYRIRFETPFLIIDLLHCLLEDIIWQYLFLCICVSYQNIPGDKKTRSSMEVIPASSLLMSFLVNFVKLNFDKV